MANRTVSVNLVANIGSYVSGMNTAAASTMRLGDSVDKSAGKAKSGFDIAGKGALIMGGAVVGGMAMAVSKSMAFEKSMSAVAAATNATTGTLAELREAAMKAGADTQYSATEAADAITEMSKAGVSAKDIMGGGLKGALSLAAAGQLEVADAAGIASVAMTQFNLSGEDLPHVADLLAAGAGKAMGSVDDLGQALNQAGLVAASTGVSIEETTGTLAAFASAGLIGSDAGTSLKTALQRLQAPSNEAATVMADLGINMYDANGAFVGMSALAGQLETGMAHLTQAERDKAMATIFGSDAVRAANVLYKEGAAGITEWTAKVNDAGYAAEQAAKLNDNLAGDLERLGGAFDTLLIALGEGAQGPLRSLVQGLTGVLEVGVDLLEFWQSLPGPVQLAVVTLGAVAALKGPVGGALEYISLKALYMKDSIAGASLSMGGLNSAAGGVVGMFGGPWGVALAAGTIMVGSFMSSLSEAESGTDRWTQALLKGGEAARKAREDYNNGDYFLRSLDEWTGLAPSLEDAEKAARDYFNTLSPMEQAQSKVSYWTNELAYRMEHLGTSHDNTRIAQERLAHWTDLLAEREGYLTAATNSVATSAEGGASAQDDFAAATADAEKAVDDAKEAVDAFKLALDILTGAHVSMIQVEGAMEAAIAEAEGALEDMTGSVLDASGALNQKSESGRAASEVLLDIRDSGNLYIAQLRQQGASEDEVREKDRQLRESFIRSAGQMGINRQAAEVLADQILGIPDRRHTVITSTANAARGEVSALQAQINGLTGKTVTVKVVTDRAALAVYAAQNGMRTVGGYAHGGYTGQGGKYEPAGIVHKGEYVLTKEQTSRLGIDQIEAFANRGYADGGIVVQTDSSDLRAGMQAITNAMAKSLVPEGVGPGTATAPPSSLVAFGRWLQSRGARVSEHPAFGGVAMGGHGKNSKHYSGRAIDVNTRAGTSALEQRELDPLMAAARAAGFQVIWRAPGHFNHGHVASYQTGTNYVPSDGLAYLHQGEAVIPAALNPRSREFSGGRGGAGGAQVVIHSPITFTGPVYGEDAMRQVAVSVVNQRDAALARNVRSSLG